MATAEFLSERTLPSPILPDLQRRYWTTIIMQYTPQGFTASCSKQRQRQRAIYWDIYAIRDKHIQLGAPPRLEERPDYLGTTGQLPGPLSK